MKMPADWFSGQLNKFYSKYSKDIGSLIIATTVIGWLSSSATQCAGIIANKKYTKEQKSFMLPQEMADAAINIISFLIITTPIKLLSKKLVTSGKVLPAKLRKQIPNNFEVGNLKTDLSKIEDALFSKPFESFYNFVSTSSAVLGGILSSNILTPILRNKYAAMRQPNVMNTFDIIETKKQKYKNKFNKNSNECYVDYNSTPSPFNSIKTY